MIDGMTGFGSAEKNGFRVEIRSLNHRFLDISVKMPHELNEHEMPLREALKKKLSRGKIDVYVSASAKAGRVKLSINRDAVKEIFGAIEGIKSELGLRGGPDMDAVMRFKELFIGEELTYDASSLYEAFERAVEELIEMRCKEGEAIASELLSRAAAIRGMNEKIAAACPSVTNACRSKYLEKLKELLPGGDDARILQEASAIAEKSDISEEVARIENHVGHFEKIVSGGGPVGRKLDFLLQELNREANTIASKTGDYGISSIVIDMKAEIEKSREQVQNLQ